MRPRWLRGVTGIAIALVVAEVVWLAVINILLLPGGVVFGHVNRKPEKARVDWTGAWSWWPGDLSVRGLRIRGENRSTHWSVAADRVRGHVALAALADRRFRACRVRAQGVTIDVRTKPDTSLEQDGTARTEPPPPKRVWAVDLRDVQISDFHEISLDEYSFRGDASANGDLFLRPKERLDVDPSEIRFGHGTVTLGTDDVLDVERGRVGFELPDVDTSVVRGRAILDEGSGRIELEAGVSNIRFVDFQLGRFPGLDLRGGSGTLSVDLLVAGGIASGRLDLDGERVGAQFHDLALRGDLRIEAKIRRWKLADGELDVSGTRGMLENVVVDAPGNDDSPGWAGRATLSKASIDTEAPFRFDATVTAMLADTRPLLAIFEAARKDLPGPLRGLFTDTNLAAKASLRVRGTAADVLTLDIDGDQLTMLSRIHVEEEGQTTGILYVERNGFSIGLEKRASSKGGSGNVKILHPKDWFEAHPLLNASR